MQTRLIPLALLTLALATVIAGCGGGSDDSGSATLTVALTDAAGDFSKVHLTVLGVRLVRPGHESDSTADAVVLLDTLDPPKELDVATLAYKEEVLGSGVVPAGTYSQVRLVLARNAPGLPPANYVTLASDTTRDYALDMTSPDASGLRIPCNLKVRKGTAALVLDFDPTRAITHNTATDTYVLKPAGVRTVLAAQSQATYGSLTFSLMPEETRPSAQIAFTAVGQTAAAVWGGVSAEDGTYRAILPAGSYTLRATATGYKTVDTSLPAAYETFAVTANANSARGTLTMTAE